MSHGKAKNKLELLILEKYLLPSSRLRAWMSWRVAADTRLVCDAFAGVFDDAYSGDDGGDALSSILSRKKDRLLTAARNCCRSTGAGDCGDFTAAFSTAILGVLVSVEPGRESERAEAPPPRRVTLSAKTGCGGSASAAPR